MTDNWRQLLATQRAIGRLVKDGGETLTPEHVATLKEFLQVYGMLTSHEDLLRYNYALIASHEHLRTEKLLVHLVNNED